MKPTQHTPYIGNSNMTSFFRFANKRAIYRLGIISLAHAPVHVTDFPVANVIINYRLPIKVFVLLDISESK